MVVSEGFGHLGLQDLDVILAAFQGILGFALPGRAKSKAFEASDCSRALKGRHRTATRMLLACVDSQENVFKA